MTPPDNEILAFLHDYIWVPAMALIGWSWTRNQREHDAMKAAHDKLVVGASKGQSILNDKIMEHIDNQVKDIRIFVLSEDAKLITELGTQRSSIEKVFDTMQSDAKRREDQHVETLNAIHALSTTMHQALAGKADR